MLFRTELHIPSSEVKIKYDEELFLIGSCFSLNVGKRLQKYKFKCISNPFGTIFNPISIAKLLSIAVRNEEKDTSELRLSQDLYNHMDFHSSFSNEDPNKTIETINASISLAHHRLKKAKHIIITLGTSIGYKKITTNEIVANCHKIPSSEFSKIDISVNQGKEALEDAISQIRTINPSVHIHFTVSPVRHIKEGIIENSRSKARLIQMIEILQSNLEFVSYFPAYEFMMDDLRDYRFYESDLIHPNEMAIDYIWNKFNEHYFTEETKSIIKKLDKIISAMEHKAFNKASDAHKKFLKSMFEDVKNLKVAYPTLNLENELAYFLS
jgi:hypothetical protein